MRKTIERGEQLRNAENKRGEENNGGMRKTMGNAENDRENYEK